MTLKPPPWFYSEELLIDKAVSIRRLPKNIDLLPFHWKELFERIRAQEQPIVRLLEGSELNINIDGAIWTEGNHLHLSHHEFSESRVIAHRLNLKPSYNELLTRPRASMGKFYRYFKANRETVTIRQLPVDLKALYFCDNRAQTNFFHWFIDAMVRLIAAKPFVRNSLLLLSEAQTKSPYVLDSLKMLGLSSDQLVPLSPQHRYSVKNLQVITGAIYSTGACTKEGIRMLRQHYLSSGDMKYRLYFARRSSLGRNIANEFEFLKTLSKFGIQTIYPEEMPLAELIELLGNAELLIGVYGAALTHCAFLPKKSNLIEIAPSKFISPTPQYWEGAYSSKYSGDYFYSLSEASGINYHLVPCEQADQSINPINAELIVDLVILRKTLEYI